VTRSDPVETGPAEGPLGRWYATPCSTADAKRLHTAASDRQQRRLRRGVSCLTCELQMMVAEFWLHRPIESVYQRVAAHSRTRRPHALVALIYGQLLASRRLPGATEQLQEALRVAQTLLTAGDYLRLLNRHALLARLPPVPGGAPAEPLENLLTAARIAARLSGERRSVYRTDPTVF